MYATLLPAYLGVPPLSRSPFRAVTFFLTRPPRDYVCDVDSANAPTACRRLVRRAVSRRYTTASIWGYGDGDSGGSGVEAAEAFARGHSTVKEQEV